VTRALQLAFLTGQSDPRSCALSPIQTRFLEALRAPGAAKVWSNFPYWTETPAHAETSLLRASVNNALQYLHARRPSFRARYREHLLDFLQAADRTLFLAGSCGLELLAGLELPAPALARIRVFAYGPVARRRPAVECRLVQGRRDWISRLWLGRPDVWIDAGHLDYLESPETRAACEDYLRVVLAESEAVGA
jgi:hypothetical protein